MQITQWLKFLTGYTWIQKLETEEFGIELEYKLKDRGKYFVRVDKFYPSSQICHNCGNQMKLTLKDKEYICPCCNTKTDRDYNAALNIRCEGLRILREEYEKAV